ncbi:unnamed protein product, partial [Discosporangium mesarthrocarpum]
MRDNPRKKSTLGVRWQLNAAMLSRPADLSVLVTLSQSKPEDFIHGDDTLHTLVSKLLNCRDETISDKDTKLDVLNILSNLSVSGTKEAKEAVRSCLQGVSVWFDEYMSSEEGQCSAGLAQDPELHKALLLLLSRAWDYE